MRPELYLAREFERCQIRPEQLAPAVVRTALHIAARLNERGLEEQIAYLIDDGLEPAEIRALVGLPANGLPTEEEAEMARADEDAIRLQAIQDERDRLEGWQ